ncbi:hypothetical protein ACFLIM_48965 [Nonomuraea sp. M3C6]|uniref:Secreted protein n=1 Tax=Nonomuraea marmarensis TaxID=3351344 RepID=A0ABW7AYL9_9ACTN
MTIRRRLVKSGLAAGAAAAVLVLITAPQASASSSVKGFSEDPTRFGTLAACQNTFTGPVTTDSSRGIVASINNVTFNFCQAGTSVTPHALPWSLSLNDSSYTIKGFSVNIATPKGRCQYSGTVNGFMEFPGVYDLRGLLTRQGSGCGGPEQLNVSNLSEVIGTNG